MDGWIRIWRGWLGRIDKWEEEGGEKDKMSYAMSERESDGGSEFVKTSKV